MIEAVLLFLKDATKLMYNEMLQPPSKSQLFC